MAEGQQQQQKQKQRQQQQPEQPGEEQKQKEAPSVIVSDNPDLANAINLADKVRSRVSNYPHQVRSQPPLPHGFVEGGLMGLATYFFFWPVRAQLMRFAGQSKQWSHTKPFVGIFCTAGQALVSAKAALYTATLIGSKEYLAMLSDFASSSSSSRGTQNNTNNHYHKTLLAKELCQDSIVVQTQKSGHLNNDRSADGGGGTSLADWLRDPEQVVVQELFRAVRSCQNRNDSNSPKRNTPIQADDKKL